MTNGHLLGQAERFAAIEDFRQWAELSANPSHLPEMPAALARQTQKMAPSTLSDLALEIISMKGAGEALAIMSAWARAAERLAGLSQEAWLARGQAYPKNPIADTAARWRSNVGERLRPRTDALPESDLCQRESLGLAIMAQAIKIEAALELGELRANASEQAALDLGLCHAMNAMGSRESRLPLGSGLARAWIACGASPNAALPFGLSKGNCKGRPVIEGMLITGNWRAAEILAREGAAVSSTSSAIIASGIHEALTFVDSRNEARSNPGRISAACALAKACDGGLEKFRTRKGADFATMALRSCLMSASVKNVSLFESAGVEWSDRALAQIPSMLKAGRHPSPEAVRLCLGAFYKKKGIPPADWLGIIAEISINMTRGDLGAWCASLEEWSARSAISVKLIKDGIFAFRRKSCWSADAPEDPTGPWLARVEAMEIAAVVPSPPALAARNPFSRML